jgi:hypothetical protein
MICESLFADKALKLGFQILLRGKLRMENRASGI